MSSSNESQSPYFSSDVFGGRVICRFCSRLSRTTVTLNLPFPFSARFQSAMSWMVSLFTFTITSPAFNPADAPGVPFSTARTSTPFVRRHTEEIGKLRTQRLYYDSTAGDHRRVQMNIHVWRIGRHGRRQPRHRIHLTEGRRRRNAAEAVPPSSSSLPASLSCPGFFRCGKPSASPCCPARSHGSFRQTGRGRSLACR